jgi:hypothetical protein
LGHRGPILAHERLKIWPRSTTLTQRSLLMNIASFAQGGMSTALPCLKQLLGEFQV